MSDGEALLERRRSQGWWTIGSAALVVAVVCTVVGVQQYPGTTRRVSFGVLVAVPSPTEGYRAPRIVAPAPHSPDKVPTATASSPAALRLPRRLSIPQLGVSAPLILLGLKRDGTVQVPTSASQPGWYRLGPSPGEVGSAVILGHVDSYRGPGIFFNLRSLRLGSAIFVTLASGRRLRFRVTAVRTYSKSAFPSQLVYGNHGIRELQLVTCGGKFNAAVGHYESNVVVFSKETK